MCTLRLLASYCLAVFLAAAATAQVRSSLLVDPGSATKQPSARLTVVIDPDWHISSLTQPDGGPFRTTIEIPPDQPYRLSGKISAPPPRKEHSAEFDVEVQAYEGRIEFVLPLEKNADAKGPPATTLTVRISYQACNGETCRLPETEKITAHFREP